MTLAFDNDASRNGQFTFVTGDVSLSSKYYPYIRERKMGDSLSLFGKKDFLSLRVDEISSVKFSHEIDEGEITRFVGLEKK